MTRDPSRKESSGTGRAGGASAIGRAGAIPAVGQGDAPAREAAAAGGAPGGEPPEPSFTADDRRYAFAVARRIVRDEQDAQDVAQDALLLAFRHRGSFRGHASPRTWFHRIVITTALSHLRAAARRRRQLEAVSAQPSAPPPTPEQALGKHEQAQLLTAHVARLCEKYRSVLTLRIEELSDAEIARRLAISVASVKVRSHRARHQLREAMAHAAPDGEGRLAA